jgi:hypothetical protein
MEICKNKASGQYFIYIRENGDEEALLVTPEAQIKSLRMNLFDDPQENDEAYLLESKLITADQVRRFHEYNKNRSDDVMENMEDYFGQMSPYEQDVFIRKLQEIAEKKRSKT